MTKMMLIAIGSAILLVSSPSKRSLRNASMRWSDTTPLSVRSNIRCTDTPAARMTATPNFVA